MLSFGADWNLMYSNYLNCVDTRYLLKTDDGALISLTTIGRAVIKPEQDAAMERGEYVDPADYYFRQHLLFETGDERYQWLNGACCFGILGCKDEWTIVYDAVHGKIDKGIMPAGKQLRLADVFEGRLIL